MDIAKALTFVAEDEDWVVKIGIGAVLSLLALLILPIFPLVGYVVAVTRNVRDGVARPLPQWDNWGKLFMDGLYIIVAQTVYTLPFWLLLCGGTVATIGLDNFNQLSEDMAMTAIVATWAVTLCLTFVLMVALVFISPAIVIQYVRHETFGSVFRVGEVLNIVRENAGSIVMVALVSILASVVLSTVVGALNFIPCLGTIIGLVISIVTGPWLAVTVGHLYGQIASKGAYKAAPSF